MSKSNGKNRSNVKNGATSRQRTVCTESKLDTHPPLPWIAAKVPTKVDQELRAIAAISGLRLDLVVALALKAFTEIEFETHDDRFDGRLSATESRVREVQARSLGLLRDSRYREDAAGEDLATAVAGVVSLSPQDARSVYAAFRAPDYDDENETSWGFKITRIAESAATLTALPPNVREIALDAIAAAVVAGGHEIPGPPAPGSKNRTIEPRFGVVGSSQEPTRKTVRR